MLKATITNLEKSSDDTNINVEVSYADEEAGFHAKRVFQIGDTDTIDKDQIIELIKKEGQVYKNTLTKEEELVKGIDLKEEIVI